MFVDRVQIRVEGGRGGDGCVGFRREKYVPKGGPSGGNGGDGGSVIIVAREQVNSLVALAHRTHWLAERGVPGQGSDCHGKKGPDVYIEVPLGTLIRDHATGLVLKDLARDGEQVVVAQGGKGGKGNSHFKSATNRAPRQSTPGEEGQQRHLDLELKVIADVGIIGKPNAGKSTLLSRLSRARPEIADYPFTTKFPNLGMVQLDMNRGFVMADIPGLIEGAHAGAGLGHEFLKHIERAGILVHLVEPLPMDQTDPIQNYLNIRDELVKYSDSLATRPEIAVVSKGELPVAAEVQQTLQERLGRPVLMISAVTGVGLKQLTEAVYQALVENQKSKV
jgi:GTP-binding protein